jgi:hypothetical protein
VAAVGIACALFLLWGYRLREELYFSPEEQPGYALGLIGTACMLLLLLYSLRKRIRALSSLGPIRSWFQLHMMLGLLGPTAILFHCNFQVGSVNSGVALACVLLVAGSGLIGRFLYPRIYHGLSDRRATLAERRSELDARRSALAGLSRATPELDAELRRFEAAALAPAGGAARAWQLVSLGSRGRGVIARARRALRRPDAQRAGLTLREVRAYVGTVRRLARFSLYERVFALWHAVHLPLCVLLFTAAAVHVIAVSMY